MQTMVFSILAFMLTIFLIAISLGKDEQYQYARQELAIIKNSIQTPELQDEPNLNDGLYKSKGSVASFSHAQKYTT